MDSRRIAAGHFTAFITILIWGTTYISTKVLLVDFMPIEILFYRFMIGYITLLLVYPHRLNTTCFKEESLFMAAGLCGVTLYFLLENIALTYTLASNVGVIISIAPLLTAVFAHFFLDGEKFRPQFFAGFIIAILGIVLIGLNGSFILKLNPIGDILATLAAVVWALYSVLVRKISMLSYNTIGSTRRVFFYGLLLMIPALFFFNFHIDLYKFTNPSNLLNILFLGFGASALCFVSWNWAVGVLGAVKTSTYIYLVPVITITASALILHERITWLAIFGASFTLAGLYISERKTAILIKENQS